MITKVDHDISGLYEEESYFMFRPRPDQPERYDQQQGFYNSNTQGVAWLVGGNASGCLGAEQEIYDPVLKRKRRVDSIDSDFHVWSINDHGERIIAKASHPKIYGVEDLYRITLSVGHQFIVTLGHRVLTDQGWREIGDIVRELHQLCSQKSCADSEFLSVINTERKFDDRIREVRRSGYLTIQNREVLLSHFCTRSFGQESFSEIASEASTLPVSEIARKQFPECERHSSHKPSNFQGCYFSGHRQNDAQFQLVSDIGQASFPQLADALGHNRLYSLEDDLDILQECIRVDQQSCHLSKNHFFPSGRHDCEAQRPHALGLYLRSSGLDDIHAQGSFASNLAKSRHQEWQRFLANSYSRQNTRSSSGRSAKEISEETYQPHLIGGDGKPSYITSIEFLRKDCYWDFSVDQFENYWMDGVYHHNTTEVALAKIAKLVLRDQPPPRKDTPFWIISGTYEQTMAVAWKEKLYGHGHIPGSEVDWDRVRWYRPHQEWPYEIPLKPWPDRPGKNWTLVFKSYEQGRAPLQAQSIGGFCFIEQFPWGLLEEVLRGCRDYNFPGSKFCEFTPVDPNLSIEVERMLEEPELIPEGWEFYRANTQCALEAGHVEPQWFTEFFGMVSDEMVDTRMTGGWASFVGQIYQTFNPLVHCVGDEKIDFPTNIFHRRGIDWGAGPANAFCCLWLYRNGLGQNYVYDEYYSTDQNLTTVDHLCEVCDRWPWPNKNPHFGTTYADPSDPDNIRIAQKLPLYTEGNYDQLDMSKGLNAVLEGIEHIRWLLKPTVRKVDVDTGEIRMEPRLFIHRKNCPNLSRQMRSYRWLASRQVGINPRDARREPLKKEDHACLAGSVEVQCEGGYNRCIADLKVGDYVYSHRGLANVDAVQCTGVEELFEVILCDGTTVECTENHPFWTGRGLVPCKSLNTSQEPERAVNTSNTKTKNGGDTQTLNIEMRDTTFTQKLKEQCLLFTERFGKTIVEQYQRVATFITKMKIMTTTAFVTSNVLRPVTTICGMVQFNSPELITIQKHGNVQLQPRKNGQKKILKREKFLEERQLMFNGRNENISNTSVRDAERSFRAALRYPDSALIIAEKNPGKEEKSVQNAGLNLFTAFRKRERLAASRANTNEDRVFVLKCTGRNEHKESISNHKTASSAVVAAKRQRTKPVLQSVAEKTVVSVRSLNIRVLVYNLSTSDGTFFANGVLVSNCDALRYIVFSEAQQQGLTPSSAKREDRSRQHGVHLHRR